MTSRSETDMPIEASETYSEKTQEAGFTPIEGLLIPNEVDQAQFNSSGISTSEGFIAPGSGNKMLIPNNYSRELAKEKGLIETSFGEKFFYIQALYRKVLENYLMNELRLAKYEEELQSTDVEFLPREPERKIFYQRYSTLPLDYFYLRNNIHIERLSEEELKPFISCWENNEASITAELTDIVVATYPTILKYYSDNENSSFSKDSTVYYAFGPTKGKEAPNESVVLDIALKDNWGAEFDQINAMEEYLNENFIPKMEDELSGSLACPVVIQIGDMYVNKNNN